MVLVPPDEIAPSGSKLCICWHGQTLNRAQLSTHSPGGSQGSIVSLAIVEDEKQYLSQFAPNDLHLTIDCSSIDSTIARQIYSLPHPIDYRQTVTDPSILHLLQLLQTELQTPQPMSQIVVSSIAILQGRGCAYGRLTPTPTC